MADIIKRKLERSSVVKSRNKEKIKRRKLTQEVDVEVLVTSLIGTIPDTGKTLEEYRNERLKKYETSD